LERARSVAMLGPGPLSEWMRKQGHPQRDAWCGQFAASVVKSAGGTPPRGWAIASNWRNSGKEVSYEEAQPGDIAVRRGVRTGSTGSHVTILNEKLKGGRFAGLGGNQRGGRISQFNTSTYQFYRPNTGDGTATAGRKLDRPMSNEINTKATGKVSANVTAPAGTKVEVTGSGMFNKTETNRSTPLPASMSI